MAGISLTLGDVNDTPTEPQPQNPEGVKGQGQPVQPQPQNTGSGLKQLLQDGNQILDEGLQMYQKLQRAQALAGGQQSQPQSASPSVAQGEPTGADESITRKVEVEDEGQPSTDEKGVEAILAKIDNDQVLEWSKNIVGRIHNDLRRQYDRKPTVEDLEVYLNENEDELKQLMDKGRQMLKTML